MDHNFKYPFQFQNLKGTAHLSFHLIEYIVHLMTYIVLASRDLYCVVHPWLLARLWSGNTAT